MPSPHVETVLKTLESLLNGNSAPAFGTPEATAYLAALHGLVGGPSLEDSLVLIAQVLKLMSDTIIARNARDTIIRRALGV